LASPFTFQYGRTDQIALRGGLRCKSYRLWRASSTGVGAGGRWQEAGAGTGSRKQVQVQEQKGRFSHAQVGKALKLKMESLKSESLIGWEGWFTPAQVGKAFKLKRNYSTLKIS